MNKIHRYFNRFAQAHYFDTARHPRPFIKIAFTVLIASFFPLTLVAITFTDYFQQQTSFFVPGNAIFLVFGILTVFGLINMVSSIQGYRHRNKIKDSDIPTNLAPVMPSKSTWLWSIALFAFIKLLMVLYEVYFEN